jgi:hypothetical protein
VITGYLNMERNTLEFYFDYIPLGPKVLTLPSGTKQSAGGLVTSKTGKKALGEGLDAMAASMKTEEKGAPKAKAKPKAKSQAKQKDERTKTLQKDIKALLTRIISYQNQFFRFVTSNLVSGGFFTSHLVSLAKAPGQGAKGQGTGDRPHCMQDPAPGGSAMWRIVSASTLPHVSQYGVLKIFHLKSVDIEFLVLVIQPGDERISRPTTSFSETCPKGDPEPNLCCSFLGAEPDL